MRMSPHATTIRPERRSRADWAALGILLIAAGFVFFWNLTASGYANEFYSAAAQAGSQSWSAFLWGGLDAGGGITVDKPPASLWLMALSVRLLGLSSFSILLPQAVMGALCTYLIYGTVRRYWGNAAGVIAGTVFITTPVAALMFRFNNPDALLVLLMLAAAMCVLRGLELPCSVPGNRRHTLWYALAGALIGLGFLTKQLQVALVLPGFGLAMLLLSPAPWPRRLLDALVALGAMVLAAGWWVVLTAIVPSGSRPYIGGSQNDSFIELTFGYNGLGRLTGDETGSVIPGASESLATGTSQGGMWGATGLLRLWGSDFGDQITWLAPLAFLGIIVGAASVALARRGSAEKVWGTASATDPSPKPEHNRMRLCCIVIFGCWLVVTWLVFSLMAGIFHSYYTVALAPAIAVLVGVCCAVLHELRDRSWVPGVAGLAIAGTSAWGMALVLRSGSFTWLGVVIGVAGVASGVALGTMGWWRRFASEGETEGLCIMARCALVLGCAAVLTGPLVWTACTIASGHTGSIVTAGPTGSGNPVGGFGNGSGSELLQGSADDSLVSLLTQHASGYRWAAATTGSQNAASYQLASKLPVMAIGGFNGSDPAPTLEQFKSYVEQGLIKYYIASGEGMGGMQMGGSDAASEIATWVAQNFSAQTVGNATVYDLQAS